MKVLLDSDALIALYSPSDALSKKAKKIYKRLLEEKTECFITNLVLQETATVISHKFGQDQSLEFLDRLEKIDIEQIFVNERLTVKAWHIFKSQKKKGTSFIDCANIAICQEKLVDQIMSFDKFYQKKELKVVQA